MIQVNRQNGGEKRDIAVNDRKLQIVGLDYSLIYLKQAIIFDLILVHLMSRDSKNRKNVNLLSFQY